MARAGAVLVALSLTVPALAQGAVTPTPGKVTFMLNAKTPFEPYVTGSTPAQQQWMRDHYWRARAYPPFYDRALSWSPPAYSYKDLYAIYDQAFFAQHPDWVLRDAQGHPLYIPYGCSGGSCPQYAADIGNPSWRQQWIADIKAQMARGYIGVHIDDVNLGLDVGNGQGEAVRPIDPRTGRPMSDADWTRYVVEFVKQIRAELPGAFISINTVWWQDRSDPSFQAVVHSADAVEVERGFSDPNLNGQSYEQLLSYIDWLHAQGRSVILQPYNLTTEVARGFELASYFLVQQGQDAITSDDRSYPGNWWTGWQTDLGSPQGARYRWHGLFRRDFANGMVLVNEPDGARQTVSLGAPMKTLDGQVTRTLTLGAHEGVVLSRVRSGARGAHHAQTRSHRHGHTHHRHHHHRWRHHRHRHPRHHHHHHSRHHRDRHPRRS